MAETAAHCSEERRRPPQRSGCPPGPTTLPAADHEYLRRSSDRQRRQVRRWRLVTAALAALALAAGTLSVVAVRRGNQLAEQLAAANADTLGRESQNRAPSDLATSTQLALAAWKADPKSPQARTALGQSYLAMRSAELTMPYVTSATSADMLAGGDTVVRVQPPGVVVVTGLAGPSPQRHELHDVLPGKTALCPDGRQLADVGPDGSIRLRSTDTLDAPRVLTNTHGAPQGSVGKLLYSPDGNRLAWLVTTGDATAQLRIWDLCSGTEVPHNLGPLPTNEPLSVFLSADPNVALLRYGQTYNAATRIVERSLADGTEVATLRPGAAVGKWGAASVSCGDNSNYTSTVVVTPIGGAASKQRVPAAATNAKT